MGAGLLRIKTSAVKAGFGLAGARAELGNIIKKFNNRNLVNSLNFVGFQPYRN